MFVYIDKMNILKLLFLGLFIECVFCQYINLYENVGFGGSMIQRKPGFGNCGKVPDGFGVSSIGIGGTFSSGPSQLLHVFFYEDDNCNAVINTCFEITCEVGWFKSTTGVSQIGSLNDKIRSFKINDSPTSDDNICFNSFN